MTGEIQDVDSMCHASISTTSTLGSLHASFNSNPTFNSLDTLENSTASTLSLTTKKVRWAPKKSKQPHITRSQMTFEEAKQTWILEDEKAQKYEEHLADMKRELDGVPEDRETYYRGLDGLHADRVEKIQKNVRACVQAVMEEQEKLQMSSSEVDPLQIAMASASISAESLKRALSRAEIDAKAAKEVYEPQQQTETKSFCTNILYRNTRKVLIVKGNNNNNSNRSEEKAAPPRRQPYSRQLPHSSTRPTTNHLKKYTRSPKTRIAMRG